MSLYCPRCDVDFEKDLSRCPGCGWDFRAHIIPENFLVPPLDLEPIRDFGRFLVRNALLVWVNGITVLVLWMMASYLILRVSLIVLRVLDPAKEGVILDLYLVILSLILATILMIPVWANYLFGLLRRYRYHVPVAYFQVIVPGRSRYVQAMGWGLPCLLAGGLLLALFIVPGVICLVIFIPLLLLLHLDKRNISNRRMAFILNLTFRRLWLLFLMVGVVLTVCWLVVVATAMQWLWVGLAFGTLLIPAQAAFAVLLYETLLGRENLDVD